MPGSRIVRAPRRVAAWTAALASVLGLATAQGAAADEPGRPRPLPLGEAPGPTDSASERALEKTIVHGEVESDRARRKLLEIDRRAAEAATPAGRPGDDRPGPVLQPPRTTTPSIASESARTRQRLRLEEDITEVERMLSDRDLGPTTRSVLEHYHNELLADRTRLGSQPGPDSP